MNRKTTYMASNLQRVLMSENSQSILNDQIPHARVLDSGLHRTAFEVLCKHVPLPADLWDIGCGQGAFGKRALESGYNVHAVDGDIQQFKLPGVICHNLNFDDVMEVENFVKANGGRANVAVALEVVEHVRNPWEFVKFCAGMTKPDGYVLLSTPNIGSIYSRMLFLCTGEFLMFRNYQKRFGHINPLTAAELETIFDHYSLEVIVKAFLGKMPSHGNIKHVAKHIVGVLVSRLLSPFIKGDKNGIYLLYLVRKRSGI
jgi:2-polyprenyl-3-methyl-5-hydroxy-6-metoxy-1,4-benzoquinol methylase